MTQAETLNLVMIALVAVLPSAVNYGMLRQRDKNTQDRLKKSDDSMDRVVSSIAVLTSKIDGLHLEWRLHATEDMCYAARETNHWMANAFYALKIFVEPSKQREYDTMIADMRSRAKISTDELRRSYQRPAGD